MAMGCGAVKKSKGGTVKKMMGGGMAGKKTKGFAAGGMAGKKTKGFAAGGPVMNVTMARKFLKDKGYTVTKT